MVIICCERSELILSTSAAKVVDLPEPVGPVTNTKPRGKSANVLTTGGIPSSDADLISFGIKRRAAAKLPRSWKALTRNLPSVPNANEKSNSLSFSKICR